MNHLGCQGTFKHKGSFLQAAAWLLTWVWVCCFVGSLVLHCILQYHKIKKSTEGQHHKYLMPPTL